jgi:ADP-heptose:LPS heptosyltransferase
MPTATVSTQSRFQGRARVVGRALLSRAWSGGLRSRPIDPRRILIAHHLLLGDTLMLTALIAKLRERHPAADIVMALPEPYAPLYAGAPYRVRAIGWSPRDPAASKLWREESFDLAIVPGDNRMSWLALALRSRWIMAFDGDSPPTKSWPVDELWRYPDRPAAWSDMVAGLIEGPPPAPFRAERWPAPPAETAIAVPSSRYALLHVGASTPLKRWGPQRWAALAARFAARGIEPIWSAGPGEKALVRACDPDARYRSVAEALTLTQLWHLLAGASVLVCPDTGVAHLGRVVGTPTVALFGPGSAVLTGAGRFWREMPYKAVTVDPFPCRDQRVLFRREIAWVRRCGRTLDQCAHPRCMDAIELDAVTEAIASLGVVLD